MIILSSVTSLTIESAFILTVVAEVYFMALFSCVIHPVTMNTWGFPDSFVLLEFCYIDCVLK